MNKDISVTLVVKYYVIRLQEIVDYRGAAAQKASQRNEIQAHRMHHNFRRHHV